MELADARRNWGDPYIGLHLAAQAVEGFTKIAVDTPLMAMHGRYSTLGNPDIWEDISVFLQKIISWEWVQVVWGFFQTWIITPIKLFWQDAGVGGLWYWFVDKMVDLMIWGNNVVYFVQDWIAPMWTSFSNWIWSLPTNLAAGFTGWFTYGQTQIERLATWWNTTIWPAISALIDTLTGLPADLWTTLLGWFGWTGAQVERLATWWNATIWPGISGLIESLTNLPADLWTTLFGWFGWTGAQVERLASWWAGLPGFLGTEILPLLWTTVDEWIASPGGSFAGLWHRWVDLVVDGADKIATRTEDVVKGWVRGFETLPATYLNYVAQAAGTNLAEEPWRALTTTGSLYSLSIAAGSAAHVLSTALNIVPTQNWVGAAQFSAFIAQAAGFDRITDATYGVLLNDALAWPLRYYWNEMLRPKLPTEGTIFLMGRKRGLTREEFGQAMAYQGHPESWIAKQYQFFWTDPSPYWLLRMSEHSTPELTPSATFLPWLEEWLPGWRDDPWAWFKMKLMLAGFEDTDIPAFIDGFQRRRLGPAITQVKTSVRAMVREGYWGRAEARAALEPMGVRGEEVEYMILAEEIDYQNRFNDAEVQYYIESYRKDEISRQDFTMALSTMIVRSERIAQIVAREDTRKLPKPKPLVEAAEDPLTTSLVRSSVTSYTKAYRDYEIDLEDLRLGLTIILQDPELVDALVDAEALRYRPLPPE